MHKYSVVWVIALFAGIASALNDPRLEFADAFFAQMNLSSPVNPNLKLLKMQSWTDIVNCYSW